MSFTRTITEVGGRAQTVLTRDGRVWAMIPTGTPTASEFTAAELLSSERYAGR